MTFDFGPWRPLGVAAVAELFADTPFRWWISGGHALELYLGRRWRDHDDSDVSFCRTDATAVADVLDGWQIHLAAAGVLSAAGETTMTPM